MCVPTKEELAPQWMVFLIGTAFGIGLCIAAIGVVAEQKKRNHEEKRLDNIEKRMDEMVKQINGQR